jgi:nucleoside-diphosphate-sugar epimerase
MNPAPSPEVHVVLGAGQVGPSLARKLAKLGHDVRMISRRKPHGCPEGVTWIGADLSDVSAARRAVTGAACVYHCANPMRYDQWDVLLPPLSHAILAAVSGSGARLVMLDNLYMYGAPASGVIDDTSPIAPQSKKGELRALIAEQFFEAQRRGDLALSVLRAPDFFGAFTSRSTTFHPLFFKALAAGAISPVLGDPDLPHAHTYVEDVAQALFLLGTQPSAETKPWLAPVTWPGNVRGLFEVFSRVAGQRVRPFRMPAWAWPVLGLFDRELTGIPEMLHIWRAPYRLDDSRFRAAFNFESTPIERAASEVLAAYGFMARGLQTAQHDHC